MKKTAYILDIFPTVSETFIINEIVAVERLGLETVIFSRKRPSGEVPHEDAGRLAQRTVYFTDPKDIAFFRSFRDHLRLLLINPAGYIQTFWFAVKNKKKSLLWFFKIAGSYALMVRKHDPDHIHAHFASLAGEYAMLISRLLGLPYTFTAHGWHDIFEYPPADFRDRALRAKKVITVSQYNRNHICSKFDVPPEKIEVIHCGIKPELFTANGRSGNARPRVLSIARLHPIKGVEYLIMACKILKEKNVQYTCHIIGEGELRGHLEDLIEQFGLRHVVYLEGAQPAHEVRRQLAAADVYVNSSLCEGLSVSIMEAMASRLPVVASNVTGIGELIEDSINGHLVEPKNPTALAEAIERCIGEPKKREEMGQISRRKIEQDFSLEAEAVKLIQEWRR